MVGGTSHADSARGGCAAVAGLDAGGWAFHVGASLVNWLLPLVVEAELTPSPIMVSACFRLA